MSNTQPSTDPNDYHVRRKWIQSRETEYVLTVWLDYLVRGKSDNGVPYTALRSEQLTYEPEVLHHALTLIIEAWKQDRATTAKVILDLQNETAAYAQGRQAGIREAKAVALIAERSWSGYDIVAALNRLLTEKHEILPYEKLARQCEIYYAALKELEAMNVTRNVDVVVEHALKKGATV